MNLVMSICTYVQKSKIFECKIVIIFLPIGAQKNCIIMLIWEGGQWLSGRVLDSRQRGRGFEPHGRHCVVVLEQDTFILA